MCSVAIPRHRWVIAAAEPDTSGWMDSHHYFHIRDTLHTRPRPAASQLAHAPTKRSGALVLAGDVRTQDHLIARQVVRCGVTMHMAYWQAPTINSIRSMVGLLTGYGGCLRWPMKRAVGKGWEVGGRGESIQIIGCRMLPDAALTY